MSRKHELTVLSVDKNTPSSVVITFDKMSESSYVPGQYLALELLVNNEEVHRSYSFCSAPHENNWQIGVKHVLGGKASTFLNEDLKAGDTITSLEPMGNFVLPSSSPSENHYMFFAAGSGVTPVFSMIKELLYSGSAGQISLFYGNKSPEETMFKTELDHLAIDNSNFNIEYIFSQSGASDSLHSGRIHFGKTLELLRLHSSNGLNKQAFICGPGDMITSVKNALSDNGFNDSQIHTEFFTTPTTEETKPADTSDSDENSTFSGTAEIKITLDDEENTITLTDGGAVILDAALDSGMDAPFSCKGGVCTACRAKVTKGKVKMISNFALTDDELEEGYVLTCQSHPKSDLIELSYDE